MIVIGRFILEKFMRKHVASRKPLENWLIKVKSAKWQNFSDIKKIFNYVDKNSDNYIFDIGGNNYRLIAIVEIREGILQVKNIYTHDEYTKKYKRGK